MELIQQLKNCEAQLSEADEGAAADMDVAKRLLTHGMDALDEVRRLEIALRIKTEEHLRCSEDLMELRKSEQEGWAEAAIAWEVCASIHNTWAKGKDALYSTRHADFVKHAADAMLKARASNAPSSPAAKQSGARKG